MQLEALQSLALSVAAARSPDGVLSEMVQGLGKWDGVALARVWLLHHPQQGAAFLELKASIGASRTDPDRRWDRTDGAHHEIPLSHGAVDEVATTNRALLLQRGAPNWILQPELADAEGIESFAGQPLCFKGQVLGVVAFFSRRRLEQTDLDWLRVFADHAAVAIANARAFEEIARLKESAERERDYLREAVRSALKQGEFVAASPARRGIEHALVVASQEGSGLRLLLGKRGLLPTPPQEVAAQSNGAAEVLSEQHFQALERQNLKNALTRCEWRVAGKRGAAQLLGLSPSTLSYRMKQLGVARPAKR